MTDVIIAAPSALAIMGALGYLAALAFRHDHSRGHCGWSGCQATERKY